MLSSNCILCDNNTNKEIYIQHQNFKIILCNNCGLLYQYTPEPIESLSNIYDNIYEENPREIQKKYYWKKRMKAFFDDIDKYIKKPGHLLDFGCSYGLLMEYFIAKGWEATGIDISENAISHARSKGLKCYLKLENITSKDKFDVIVMSNVLEHLKEPIDTLRRVKDLLSKEGIIYIRVPNAESIIFPNRRQSFIGDLKPHEHLFYFNKDTLALLFKKVGLKSYIKTDGTIDLGNVINNYLRRMFVLKNSWQNLNYKKEVEKKSKYLSAKYFYGEVLSVLGYIPLGKNNREIVAFASRNNVMS